MGIRMHELSRQIEGSLVKGQKKIISFTAAFITAAHAVFAVILIPIGITLIDPTSTSGQSKGRAPLPQASSRDPFLLPSGVHLLSKIDASSEEKRILSKGDRKPNDALPSFKVKAILISDHARLALMDHHIISVGDSIHDEKVLEIKTDRVILGKGDQKRTLLLSQSPIQLTVQERTGEKR